VNSRLFTVQRSVRQTLPLPPEEQRAGSGGLISASALFASLDIRNSFVGLSRDKDAVIQRKKVIFKVGDRVRDEWQARLQNLLPEMHIVPWHEESAPLSVDYAAVWKPDPGVLATMTNLKGIVSIAAGIDHLLADPDLPRNVPVVRTTGEQLVLRMIEYVTLHCLRHHRDLDRILSAQADRRWEPFSQPPASNRQIGIMGMGVLGSACARSLTALGFNVSGWTRSQPDPARQIAGVSWFSGAPQLDDFLARTDVLVCLLPRTPETENLLDRSLLRKLPQDACLINVSRGELLVDQDLIDALDEGHLKAATLDVFREEPLGADHAFWTHPDILVTPHVASLIDANTGATLVAEHIGRFERGDEPVDLVDLNRGY